MREVTFLRDFKPVRQLGRSALTVRRVWMCQISKFLRYWGTPWTSIDSAHDFMAKESQAMSAGKHIRLGIELTESGELIGVRNLFNCSAPSRRAKTGYCLAKTAWRQDYVTESLTALLDYGFQVLDLNRIVADIDPINVASAKNVEGLGAVLGSRRLASRFSLALELCRVGLRIQCLGLQSYRGL